MGAESSMIAAAQHRQQHEPGPIPGARSRVTGEAGGGAGPGRTPAGPAEVAGIVPMRYSEEDCRVTFALRDWLLPRKPEATPWLGPVAQRENGGERLEQYSGSAWRPGSA